MSINLVFGEEGIITQAQQAKVNNILGERNEEIEIAKTEWKAVEYGISNDKVSNVVDGVPIPKGFTVSPYEGENLKQTGLVIYELNEGEESIPTTEEKETSTKTRNQYVWVPVEDVSKFAILQNQTANYRGVLYTKAGGNTFNLNTVIENTTYNPTKDLREPAINKNDSSYLNQIVNIVLY